MWVFRDQGKFTSSVNFDVLDVALQRGRKVFRFCELGCVRCGFTETRESFQAL